MKNSGKLFLAGTTVCALLLSGAVGCADMKGDPFEDPNLTVKAVSVEEALDISDTLFGIFLEDINYASYALDDNLLANGNFESLGTTPNANNFQNNWTPANDAEISVENTDGILSGNEVYTNSSLNVAVNPHYAKVQVLAAGGGLANSGYTYPKLAVQNKQEYTFSAFIKSPETSASATAKIVDKKGAVYAAESFNVAQNTSWIKYQRTVKASDTKTEDLHFELTFDKAGTFYVDAVSFETQDSTNGIKNYIYNAIKDLSPKFMRFPGGCIIEGDGGNGGANTKEIYDWKNSVGAVQNGAEAGEDTVPAFTYLLDTNGKASEVTTYGEWATRSNNYDLWGYNMDYGLGFYEYFLLCESIGASPVPIVNCGFSDQGGASSNPTLLNGRHGKKVADYVQDALNLIEFANGDASTKWGKIRSDMGHPEPFHMKYIGIGNEQFEATYYDCYEQFLPVFRQAQKDHPEIYGGVEPIVGSGLVFSDCDFGPSAYRALLAPEAAKRYREAGNITNISEYGVVDHHYYMGYDDFLFYATPEACIYDKYTRGGADGYKVFVGEYSANDSVNYKGDSSTYDTNSWYTAISEAAYMTGLERNGDVVDLAAYAPMFGVASGLVRDDGANQWDVDMMYFTNTDLLLSANYFVQQLFMNNSGTHSLKSAITDVSEYYEGTFQLDDVTQTAFYQSVTYDENTKDIIVKLVNAGSNVIRVNVDLAGAKVKSVADCTALECNNPNAVNALGNYAVSPREFTLGVKNVFGYAVPAYSVTAIRIHTK